MERMLMKWSDELEQLLECPVCYERLNGNIWMCPTGHAICVTCLGRLRFCVTCKKPYVRTRNYLAESIATKIDSVKAKLMDLNSTMNKPNPNATSVGCQTDFDPVFPALTNEPRFFNNFIVPQGKFPCWIGYDCKFQGYYTQIIEHAKNIHPFQFEELAAQEIPNTSWEFNYRISSRIDRLFRVPKFGLFILHIDISDTGELRAYVFMYNSGIKSKDYAYQIIIECEGDSKSYLGEMDTCRIPKHALHETGLVINTSEEVSQKLMTHRKFSCSLTIEKQIEAAAAVSRMNLKLRTNLRSIGKDVQGMQAGFSQSGTASLL